MAEEKIIGRCGICCTTCPAYVGTLAGDSPALAKVAAEWSSAEDILTPEDVKCAGCFASGGRLFKHSEKCEVRKCAAARDFANCAGCSEYACATLEKHWRQFAPGAKETLDEIREGY